MCGHVCSATYNRRKLLGASEARSLLPLLYCRSTLWCISNEKYIIKYDHFVMVFYDKNHNIVHHFAVMLPIYNTQSDKCVVAHIRVEHRFHVLKIV